jgi:plastocyanin
VVAALLLGVAAAADIGRDGTGECLLVDRAVFESIDGADSGVRGYGNSRGLNLNDFDGDGDLDLFVAQAVSREVEGPTWSGDDMLYIHDLGDLEFHEDGHDWGVDDGCENRSPMFGDLDNDGVPDLFVTVNGRSVFYHNRNWEHYDDVTSQAGAANEPAWGHQGFLFDYDRDGFLDVFWTNGPEDGSGDNILLLNQGDGTFRDTTDEAGVAGVPSGKGTCVLDADVDGWPDIFVTTGREYGNQLYINQHDGTFRDEALERGVVDPLNRFGVGVTCGDTDNDGDPDILLITHDRTWTGNQFFRNDGGTFVDIAEEAGLMDLIDGHGSLMLDVDDDGWLDVVMSGIKTPPYLYLNNHDGTFARVCDGGGIQQDDGLTWAVAGADFTGDGYPELYIADGLGRRPRDDEFFRNLGGTNHYLTVAARGLSHNPSQLGAKIEVVTGAQTVTRWVGHWSSFDSQGPLAETFGLGTATHANVVRVTFTDGSVAELTDVPADQAIVVDEPTDFADADHDGVVDGWDVCPETRLGDRTDGEGCGYGQRGGPGVALLSPAEDTVMTEAGTFTWSTEAASVVLQISYAGHFGPSGRLDFGPVTGGSYTLTEADWASLLSVSDGSKALSWRLVASGTDGEQVVTDARRFNVALPTNVVHIPYGVNAFMPAHIVVDAGTPITWWNDPVAAGNLQNEPHDVQLADEHGSNITNMNTLNGAGFFTWTFNEPGVYNYICHRHSGTGSATDSVPESHMFHRAPGPYRCMAGTVTVR